MTNGVGYLFFRILLYFIYIEKDEEKPVLKRAGFFVLYLLWLFSGKSRTGEHRKWRGASRVAAAAYAGYGCKEKEYLPFLTVLL